MKPHILATTLVLSASAGHASADTASPSTAAMVCRAQVENEAFTHFRNDGGSDNDPTITVNAITFAMLEVSVAGAETGEFFYNVEIAMNADHTCHTTWTLQQ